VGHFLNALRNASGAVLLAFASCIGSCFASKTETRSTCSTPTTT